MNRVMPLMFLLLGALLPSCGSDVAPASLVRPKRIVLVTIDTLRADAVTSYGGTMARTHALDALAASGVRFHNAISPAPITLPSHTSIMTGLAPPHHGVHDNSTFKLSEEIPTLAERLKAGGYETAAIVAAFVLDRRYGLARGFDHYDDDLRNPSRAMDQVIDERKADTVVLAASKWLEGASDQFFLWVHFYDPHFPYVGPMWQMAPDDVVRYHDEVSYVDRAVDRLLEKIHKRWPGDETLIIVTSDHGESLGQHGEGTHTLGVYDTTQRVPLIISGIGIPAGRVVEGVVRLIDLAPTILNLAGLEPLGGKVGSDLSSVLKGGKHESQAAFVETLSTYFDWGWSPLFGIRSDRFKYIRAPRRELYDLDRDPHEANNLLPGREDLADELDAILDARLREARPVRSTVTPSEDDAKRLESLGYVVSGTGVGGQALVLGQIEGADPKDKIENRLQIRAATRLMLAGRYREALAGFEGVDEISPRIDMYRAQTALGSEQLDKALLYATRSADADPFRYFARALVAKILLKRKDYAEAERALETALKLDPHYGRDALELGKLKEARGDVEAAASSYLLGTNAREGRSEALWHLAAVRIEQGQAEDAQALLAAIGTLRPLAPEAAVRLALAESRVGRSADARTRLQEALQRRPSSKILKQALAELDAQ